MGFGYRLYPSYGPFVMKIDMHSQENTPKKSGKSRKWLWWLLGSPFILWFALYGLTLLINPLPSDEKMIAYFQVHREEFETLAKNFRAFLPTPEARIFEDIPENKKLIEKAAIKWVSQEGATWFPNPYSEDAAREFAALTKQVEIATRLKQKGANALEFVHPYKSIGFAMQEEPLGRSYLVVLLFPLGLQMVFKQYMYIPEVPKIENGRLWYPIESTGLMKWSSRAYSSLNTYPWNWKKGECVYRQFEPHWLINMCITG